MAYRHISNLYSDDRVLQFKRLWALEKIHGCLKKGTLVRMADGREKPIEQLTTGDMVLSFSIDDKKFVKAEAKGVIVQERDINLSWIEVVLEDGRTVTCTEDHPFYTTNRGWVPAGDLTLNDDVLTV